MSAVRLWFESRPACCIWWQLRKNRENAGLCAQFVPSRPVKTSWFSLNRTGCLPAFEPHFPLRCAICSFSLSLSVSHLSGCSCLFRFFYFFLFFFFFFIHHIQITSICVITRSAFLRKQTKESPCFFFVFLLQMDNGERQDGRR